MCLTLAEESLFRSTAVRELKRGTQSEVGLGGNVDMTGWYSGAEGSSFKTSPPLWCASAGRRGETEPFFLGELDGVLRGPLELCPCEFPL